MSFKFVRQLPSPDQVKEQTPMSEEMKKIKEQRDRLIQDVITGDSDKFLVIVGPCSADNEDSVCEYTNRLAKVQEKVADRLVLVPRIYTNKPRTTGEGYKGMLHQPDPEAQPDVMAGILAIRHMHMRSMEETGLTSADEMLYPDNWHYLSDLLSYVAIGARSVENQEHRLMVSGLDIPAGMKNPTSGDFSVMLNSVVAAQGGHDFISRGWEVKTEGNPLTHTILRGAVNKHGNTIPNYHYEDLQLLLEMYEKRDLKNPAVIIDANHSNSGKKYEQQIRIVKEVLHSRLVSPDIQKLVKGVMIESYLVEGSQKIGPTIYMENPLPIPALAGKIQKSFFTPLRSCVKFPQSKKTFPELCGKVFLFSGMRFHVNIPDFMDIHIHINLCSGNIRMAHHFLYALQVCSVLYKMCRKRMPKGMRCDILLDSCRSSVSFQNLPESLPAHRFS